MNYITVKEFTIDKEINEVIDKIEIDISEICEKYDIIVHIFYEYEDYE